MHSFEDYVAHFRQLVPALSPKNPGDEALSREILAADLFPGKSGEMVECSRAGLLLLNDDLHAAHEIVQNIKSQTGSFWHAIVHRREGDFGNARYWWNLTGQHPAFEEICDLVLHKVPDFPFLDELRVHLTWEPVTFTDFCQRGEDASLLCQVQKIEMGTLLQWCASRVK